MDGIEKLKQDLVIIEAMASEMDEYLTSDVLFWPMERGDLPRLTLGGYLMRRHRLAALSALLDEGERNRLQAATTLYREALAGKIVRFENRAHEELAVRMRQWERFLNSNSGSEGSLAAYYATSVETRAMIASLVDELQSGPFQLPERTLEQLALFDRQLHAHWRTGEFVWPDDWRPAYPPDDYWWLYGRPA